MAEDTKESSKLLMWIVQALLGLVMFFLGIYVKSVSDAVTENRRDIDAIKQPVYSTVENVKNLNEWLNRVEAKIDRVLETYRQQQ